MHLRALANCLVASTRRSAQLRNAAQKTGSLDHPLFRRVGFLQFTLLAFDRQHDRRHTLAKSLGCARNVVISASSLNSPTAIPSPPAELIKSNLPCIGLNRTLPSQVWMAMRLPQERPGRLSLSGTAEIDRGRFAMKGGYVYIMTNKPQGTRWTPA